MAKQAALHEPRVDADEATQLEALIGYNLKRAYVVVRNDFRKALGEDGLSARVFSALAITVHHENVTQSELARMMGVERSGMVAIVDELEGRGYLRREAVPGDRRAQALVPTPEGREVHAVAIKAVNAHEAQLLSEFTEDEKTTLLRLLQKVRSAEDQA